MENKILGFDGVRGLAVMSVVLSHLGVFSFLVAKGVLSRGLAGLISSDVGVRTFFVLSGFLITMLLVKEFDERQQVSLKNFYIRRVLRIVPIYVVFLLLVTVFRPVVNVGFRSLIFVYTYMYNFIPQAWYQGILGHTWSLAVEEHFYLIWPLVFSGLIKQRREVILTGIVTVFVFSIVTLNLLSLSNWLTSRFFVSRWTIVAGSEILVGCFLAILITGLQKNEYWVSVFQKKPVFFLGLLFYANTSFLGIPFHLGEYLRSIGIGLVLGWIYMNQHSLLVKLLEFAPLRILGVVSYGVYLWQGFFLSTGPSRSAGAQWPPHPIVGLILLIITVPFSYHFFEKPFLRLKTKFSRI